MNVWAYFHYGQLRHNVIYPANGYAEKCLNICANVSIKGAKGQKIIIRAFIEDEQGNSITAYDVLTAIEIAMVEKTDSTVEEKQPLLDKAMQEIVFSQLDDAVKSCLEEITLEDVIISQQKEDLQQMEKYYRNYYKTPCPILFSRREYKTKSNMTLFPYISF